MGGPLPLIGAVLAVAVLLVLVRLLGFRSAASLAGRAEAEELAQALPGGFVASDVLLADDGSGALLRDAAGRVALVAPIGAHFLVRLRDSTWSLGERSTGSLAITGSDFTCNLALPDAARRWLEGG